mgnify:CR=1 FL=1
MKNLNTISEDLFNKIRGRFPNLTIGDQNGNIVTEPAAARFFDFEYKEDGTSLGTISISLSEDDGISIIYSRDFINDQDNTTQKNWYNFLKELREFAKKRLLNFDVRDINKTNLTKRDYKFLANRSGDNNMNETKLYGTSRISYQKIGEARIMIKHTESVNQESATGRTQKIGKIYIESSDGERFRYPYKHLSGARAMARHVSEGGNAYDDFGKHIVGLSEEMSKLRKFKNYMGRSAVMAESLAGYTDIVKERIATVKKTIESLQKPAYYKETFEAFETPVMEDVPSDVAENWIDQLTIKQFNEELSDVFPYIYKLVSEASKAKSLGPDDLVDEGEQHGNSKIYDKCRDGWKKKPGATRGSKGSCIPEEAELEQGFEEMMGQFAEAKECEECNCAPCECDTNEEEVQEAYIDTSKDAIEVLGALRGKGKAIERGQDDDQGNLANQYVSDVWDVYSFIEARTNGFSGLDKNAKAAIEGMMKLRGEAKKLETEPGSGKNSRFGNAIVTALYPVMEYLYTTDFDRNKKEDDTDEGNAYSKAVADAKRDGKKKGDKIDGPDGDEITLEKDDKTPLGEFILSYFDKESGEFPKGETAVLTMIEKDYGEQFIEPAKAFIEQIQAKFEEFQMHTQPQQMEAPDEYERMRELAGLR